MSQSIARICLPGRCGDGAERPDRRALVVQQESVVAPAGGEERPAGRVPSAATFARAGVLRSGGKTSIGRLAADGHLAQERLLLAADVRQFASAPACCRRASASSATSGIVARASRESLGLLRKLVVGGEAGQKSCRSRCARRLSISPGPFEHPPQRLRTVRRGAGW